MAGTLSQEVKAEPNLTPMLDMVFQLITFFVLVINFRSAEIDFSLNLPVVGSARPVETGGHVGLLVLNIDSKGNVRSTQKITDIDNFLRIQAQLARRASQITLEEIEQGSELPTTVVIRADRETPFGKINRVIKACQENGFRSFALKAKMSKEG